MVQTEKETWRWVKGYRGLYAVSSIGRVCRVACGRWNGKQSILRYTDDEGRRRIQTRMLKLGPDSGGYQRVNLCRDSKGKTCLVHRLVAAAFLGDPAPGLQVNHKDGDKANNCVENLEWVTPRENTLHAHRVLGYKTRGGRGETHGKARLKREQAAEIRERFGNESPSGLAREFGVSDGAIQDIGRGRTWKDV